MIILCQDKYKLNFNKKKATASAIFLTSIDLIEIVRDFYEVLAVYGFNSAIQYIYFTYKIIKRSHLLKTQKYIFHSLHRTHELHKTKVYIEMPPSYLFVVCFMQNNNGYCEYLLT